MAAARPVVSDFVGMLASAAVTNKKPRQAFAGQGFW